MSTSVAEALFLVAAGALAALVGSAGGITSLISYPALLAVGIPPLQANISNAVALVASGLGSTFGARPELAGQHRRLRRMAVPAVAGGAVGAVLLLATPADVFGWIVPFLIALAAVLLLAQPRISRWRETRQRHRGSPLAVHAGLFAVSVYGGYFGAGGGVMTLALLLLLVDQNVVRANAFKNYVLMLADVVTAVVFVVAGPVLWSAVLPLGQAERRTAVVAAGATHWAEMDLIGLDADGPAVRSLLEQFGLRVNLFPIGQAHHLVTALSEGRGAEFVVLDCHGVDGAVVLPELSPELEREQPFRGVLTGDDLRGFARFDGATVISTGCGTGTPELADAVLACGAAGYVAPAGYPEGHASFFALSYLFYAVAEGRSVAAAVERLAGHDTELAMWRYFHRGPATHAKSTCRQPDRVERSG